MSLVRSLFFKKGVFLIVICFTMSFTHVVKLNCQDHYSSLQCLICCLKNISYYYQISNYSKNKQNKKPLTDPKLLNRNTNVNSSGEEFWTLFSLRIRLSVNCQRVCAVQHTIIPLVRLKCRVTDPEAVFCVSKARLIQDEFWACQARLYQPHLTLTERLKKENMKRKDWHDEIMSYERMCDVLFLSFFFILK